MRIASLARKRGAVLTRVQKTTIEVGDAESEAIVRAAAAELGAVGN
jgi:hypothetical protein